MRLGKDALVMTQDKHTLLASMGFLSQTFNQVSFPYAFVLRAVLRAALCCVLCAVSHSSISMQFISRRGTQDAVATKRVAVAALVKQI